MTSTSQQALKNLPRQNIIRNCDVAEKDIALTKKIFGPDVATLKGKSTRQKPRKVVDKEIEIPDEFVSKERNIELSIDIIFINKETLIMTIDRSIMFKACVPLPSQEDDDVYAGLDEVLHHYNKAGYTITKIHADGEFESLMLRIED